MIMESCTINYMIRVHCKLVPVSLNYPTRTHHTHTDMGCGQVDDTLFLVEDIQPHSFDTTDLILTMLDDIDFVLHIGDISYARGFSAVVS